MIDTVVVVVVVAVIDTTTTTDIKMIGTAAAAAAIPITMTTTTTIGITRELVRINATAILPSVLFSDGLHAQSLSIFYIMCKIIYF